VLEFYSTIIFAVLNIVLPYLITRSDRKKLNADQLAGAWNGPSWACAVYVFGPLCLPAHFWVTRRKPIAFLWGGLWMTAVLAFEGLVGIGLELMLGAG
jgi:hypothetical protein